MKEVKIGVIGTLILILGYLVIRAATAGKKNQYLDSRVQYLEQRMDELEQQAQTRHCTVTAYSPTKRECDDTPWVAASGKRPKVGTVAVSRDLFYSGWPFGSRIYIEGLGIYRVNDLMHERWENRIDVFMPNTRLARKFGEREARVVLLR